jgi:hypothetical protein
MDLRCLSKSFAQRLLRDTELSLAACLLACSPVQLVSVLPSMGTAAAPATNSKDRLQVDVDASTVPLPLRVLGTGTRFIDLEHALKVSIQRTLNANGLPTKDETQRYLLYVELVEARAEVSSGRLLVQLTTRVTLRQESGYTYIAQTHVHATATGSMVPENGRPVVLDCVSTLAAQLRGWITSMPLAP